MTSSTPQPYETPAGPPPSGGQAPKRPRRPLGRRLVPPAVAAWVVLEIWLLLWLGSVIGGLGVFAVIAGGFVLGAVVVKRAGRRAWRSLAESLQQPVEPGKTAGAADGRGGNGLTMLGGLLLMFPGLVSDALGLLLLVPPVRTLVRRRTRRYLERGAAGGPAGPLGDAYTRVRIHRPDGKVVQGEVVREDEPPRS